MHIKSESSFGETFQTVGTRSKNVLSNFRISNCTTRTRTDKFASFCIDTFSMCNTALILLGILPTGVSQVIVGGNFLSYFNRKFWNWQKTQSRSLWCANYESKPRKIEAEIFHIRLIEMEILELLNPSFLFQVNETLVCTWTLVTLNENRGNGNKSLSLHMRDTFATVKSSWCPMMYSWYCLLRHFYDHNISEKE